MLLIHIFVQNSLNCFAVIRASKHQLFPSAEEKHTENCALNTAQIYLPRLCLN